MGHDSVDIVRMVPKSADEHADLEVANQIREQLGALLRGHELGMIGPILGEILLATALEFSDGDLAEARQLIDLAIYRAVEEHKAALES